MRAVEPVRLRSRLAWARLAALGLLCSAACAPDVPNQPPPPFLEFQFDPSAMPAKSFAPTSLVMNADTGLIDLSAAGIDVPAAGGCQDQSALPLAQCEFYQYLETLDGFPTLTPGTTPTSAALDLASVTLPDNLFVYDLQRERTSSDAAVTFDAQSHVLTFDPPAGWDIGTSYAVGIRGYGHGVTRDDGAQAVSSIIYVLLKSEESLTCGATSAEQIDIACPSYRLFASDPRFASLDPAAQHEAVAKNLLQLEQLRTYYLGQSASMPVDLWSTLADAGSMPKDQVAIGWFFNIHSASVFELNPKTGLVPKIVSASEIRLALKGTLDPAGLKAFSLQNPAGTVFLLDVDKLQENATDPRALPPFKPEFADGQLVLTTTDAGNPFIPGDTYAVLLTTELTDADHKPIVASPVTVLLRSRGPLVDAEGVSQVSGFSDADAQQLEQGRAQFAKLLDDPLIKSATTSPARPEGLTREQLTYLYGFPFVSP
jgi:hypothetical protein